MEVLPKPGQLRGNEISVARDHPLDPKNKFLSHSFVESPDMKNIYDGTITLDEHGEAGRAEFIRVQVEHAGMGETDSNREALSDRQSALLNVHGEAWRAELPEWARDGCEFIRGFVEHVVPHRTDWRSPPWGASVTGRE
jgi:hypothetical protein